MRGAVACLWCVWFDMCVVGVWYEACGGVVCAVCGVCSMRHVCGGVVCVSGVSVVCVV